MPATRRPDSMADDAAPASIGPAVVALRIADGAVVDDASSLAEVLTPPAKAKRGRGGEKLFFLFSPTSGTAPGLCRELHDIVRQTYWSAEGSVTAALRRAAFVANRYLFEHNLNAERSQRCYGGLACAVLRDGDLFLLQAGPVWSCMLQEDELRCFPLREKLAHMGIGPLADVRLYHVFAALGDTLLLAPQRLLRDAGEEGLRRVLALADTDSIAAGLEQLSTSDFVALIARWEPAQEAQTGQPQTVSQTRRSAMPSLPAREAERGHERRDQIDQRPRTVVGQQVRVQGMRPTEPLPARERRPSLFEKLDLRRRLNRVLRQLTSPLGHVWHGLAAIGAGLLALGKWLIGAIGMTIRSTLPGSARTVPRGIPRHPPPEENRSVMIAVAVGIPIVILVVVLVAYRQFAAQSRFLGMINQVKSQIALAQAAEADSEEARTHWEQALQQAEAAATLQPDDPAIQALRDQAQEALDRFDGIKRLTLTPLVDFGSSNRGRRLVLHDQMLFVVDPTDGWAAHVPLGATPLEGTRVEGEDDKGQRGRPVLMHTGQEVDGEDIGSLVDAAWVGREGGRRSSALVVLADRGQLISHDPAWRSESGAPQLSLLELTVPPPGKPVAVGTYEGRFYVLDTTADGVGQIWRYSPQGNAYPNQPELYFAASSPQDLSQALDMAIDGHIYILHQDGRVEKFLGGEAQPFETADVPGGLGEVAGFAVDPDGDGTVYVADRGNDRVVVLAPDGRFRSQLRADPPLASLEALAVSQADGRLYVLATGQVYVADLP